MNDIIKVLTTEECIIIYTITGILCLISILIYTFDNTKDKRRKKQNTKELNKLVEEIEEYEMYDDYDYNQVPKLETVETSKYDSKDEFIDNIAPTIEEVHNESIEIENVKENTLLEQMVNTAKENTKEEIIIPEEPKKMDSEIMLQIKELEDEEFIEEEPELEYTSIEPNKEEAKQELANLQEKLKEEEIKKEEFFNKEEIVENNNIDLNSYEEEQEENAIISLEELTKKGKEIYESNEINQYKDEGNEPISLKDLEKRMNKQLEVIAENFEINKVADNPTEEEIIDMLDGKMPKPKKMKMDNFNSIKTSKYHPSPIISPIYGIEKNYKTDIELENTANYDKLDAEIKKTNEFMMTLKELQQHQE